MADRRYIGAAVLAKHTGLSARWFTGMAARGKIPGAYQPAGERGAWRFDEAMFWRWWDDHVARESAAWRPSTVAAKSGGAVFNVKAVKSASPLRQRLKELRESG